MINRRGAVGQSIFQVGHSVAFREDQAVIADNANGVAGGRGPVRLSKEAVDTVGDGWRQRLGKGPGRDRDKQLYGEGPFDVDSHTPNLVKPVKINWHSRFGITRSSN